ncbi:MULTISPECIES: hypothetical protein [Pseudomonas syringae group]|uniref:hypothetical protein n=1 Tax=Pseudomonas syringae group TaxID=136849 RepID=UPI00211EF4FE|nr:MULTISPECIES: hypothetical protein [Pseudomonas syringae group]MDU8605982.1 hypothetical protein [Pseudomonas syringae group sp. 247E2]
MNSQSVKTLEIGVRTEHPGDSAGMVILKIQSIGSVQSKTMTYQHTDLSGSNFVEGDAIEASGPFPKKAAITPSAKKRCTPAIAGVLAGFYTSRVKNLAVLGELDLQETKDQARIDRLKANNEHLNAIAQNYASRVSLHDWKRRLSADTKRAFSFLGFSLQSDAQVINFRLGHEVAEAALSAKKGPTDYLSALLRTLGIVDLVFVLELASSDSEENHPLHLHGIARIPDTISTQDIRGLLAPEPDLGASPPTKGYRQRWSNKAIAVTELQTPGTWVSYSGKEFDFTAHSLQANPGYASRSATTAGRERYEAIRAWLSA